MQETSKGDNVETTYTDDMEEVERPCINYVVAVYREWTCPKCGWFNRTEIPSYQSELGIPAICDECLCEGDFENEEEC